MFENETDCSVSCISIQTAGGVTRTDYCIKNGLINLGTWEQSIKRNNLIRIKLQ